MSNQKTDWEKAIRYGIDVSILWHNMQMTPTDRIVALQNALENAQLVRTAGANYYAGLSKNIKTSDRK